MNEVEYRELLIETDAGSLDDRVRRRFRVARQKLGIETPALHSANDIQLIELFIAGKFAPVMLFAGIIVEIILRDQLTKAKLPPREKAGLGELIDDACKHLRWIDEDDKVVLRDLAEVRNDIAHALTGEGKGIASWGSLMEESAFHAI